MKLITLFFAIVFFISCNNSSTSAVTATDTTQAANPNWSNVGATEFLNNCVGNAQQNGRFKDEKQAFVFCNCILNQIKQKYPNLDSAQAMLADTAQLVKLQANCK